MAAPIGITVMWPASAASIPSGWSRVAALDSKMPKQVPTAATNPGTTGGALTHTHAESSHSHTSHSHSHVGNESGSSDGNHGNTHAGAGSYQGYPHGHTPGWVDASENLGSASGTSAANTSNLLSRITPIYISNGVGQGDLPNACWAWVAAAVPAGWTYQTGGNNRFFYGAAAGVDGSTTGTGSDSHNHAGGHSHSGTSHTHTLGSATNTGSGATDATVVSASVEASQAGHTHVGGHSSASATHTFSSTVGSSTSDDHKPPYYTLDPVKRTTAGDDTPNNIIAIWTGTIATIPVGWAICNGTGTPNLLDKFIRGSSGSGAYGATGGAATHTHTNSHGHSDPSGGHASSGSLGGDSSAGNGAMYVEYGVGTFMYSTSHTHTFTASFPATYASVGSNTANLDAQSALPPYYEVAYIMKTAANTLPTITGAPTATYATRTRTGPSNTWGVTFTAADAEQTGADALTYEIRTSATLQGGTLVATGTCTSGVSKVVTGLAYNASGLAQGSNTLYLHIYDGGLYAATPSSFTLLRDDSASAPTSVVDSPDPVGADKQYAVAFDAPDTYSTGANEMTWEVRTASGGGGSLSGTGTFTQGAGKSTGTFTDSNIISGVNNRWLRIIDGAGNAAEQSFTIMLPGRPVPFLGNFRQAIGRSAVR